MSVLRTHLLPEEYGILVCNSIQLRERARRFGELIASTFMAQAQAKLVSHFDQESNQSVSRPGAVPITGTARIPAMNTREKMKKVVEN
jgi:hypothetical protein